MTVWIDAQLPPTLADWMSRTFSIEAIALRDLGLRDARDNEISEAARVANVISPISICYQESHRPNRSNLY